MSDTIKHKYGVAMLRILKHLDYYLEEGSQRNYQHTVNNIINLLGDGNSYKKTADYITNYSRGDRL